MKFPIRTAIFATVGICLFAINDSKAEEAARSAPTFTEVQPILENYCYSCHGYGSEEGGISLDSLEALSDQERLSKHDRWLAVWRNVRAQTMPPADSDQPTEEERELLGQWIEKVVFQLDREKPDPGRVTIRRLNREEYRYSIQDLFGYDYNVVEAFPPDDTGYGFDTIGDVLSMSPLMTEKYFDAAQEIVQAVVYTEGPKNPQHDVWHNNFKDPDGKKINPESLPLETEQKVVAERWIEHPGEYRLTLQFRTRDGRAKTDHTAKLTLQVGADQVVAEKVIGEKESQFTEISGTAKLEKGKVPLTIVIAPQDAPGEGQDKLRLAIRKVTLEGPLDGSQAEYPDEYRKIFLDGPPPEDPAERKAYARKILKHFGRKVYRRPLDDEAVERLVSIQERISALPDRSFEHGIAQAFAAMLISPRFLFRAEVQPEPNNPGQVVPVDEFALASRLSYFLWCSTPDDELLNLAEEGKLRENLAQQVDRLLDDPKSQRFVERFVGQWLQAKDVETISIDARRVLGTRDTGEANRIFSRTVRRAMREESEKLFEYILKEDRPVGELLTANYTFLNEPLAKFYGLEDLNVKGNQMQKVDLPADSLRGGILTQGTFLVVTSNPTRSSPVKRGMFILDNILAAPPPPPPPPNVPELEDLRRRSKQMTMREQMELHRSDSLCNSCHQRMDPLGLALENFTYIGSFRETDGDQPIDASGTLLTGESFSNVKELSQVLATDRKADFYRCLTEKLLTFALGRGLEYYDTPTVDVIVEDMLANEGRMRQLIHSIVESTPFQKRRGDGSLLSHR